jgi:urease accessory protein
MSANPALFKLLQIVSPSLPVGGYSYSQGLEWAVQAGWITNYEEFVQWLGEQLDGMIAQQDLPLLIRLYHSHAAKDCAAIEYWDAMALAVRETSELRREESQRGKALFTLLQSLGVPSLVTVESQLAAFACYCSAEQIPLHDTLAGYTYSWLDSQVTAGIKLVPLGQTHGQQLLYQLSNNIEAAVAHAKQIDDADIGYTSPALTLASCFHETQYSRIYRS